MTPRACAIVNLVIGLISIGLLLYIAWLGHGLASKVAYKLTGVLKISWFWIDIAVPVGAVGMAVYTALRVPKQIRAIGSGNEVSEE